MLKVAYEDRIKPDERDYQDNLSHDLRAVGRLSQIPLNRYFFPAQKPAYSTVTLLAKFLGWSTSVPLKTAIL